MIHYPLFSQQKKYQKSSGRLGSGCIIFSFINLTVELMDSCSILPTPCPAQVACPLQYPPPQTPTFSTNKHWMDRGTTIERIFSTNDIFEMNCSGRFICHHTTISKMHKKTSACDKLDIDGWIQVCIMCHLLACWWCHWACSQ